MSKLNQFSSFLESINIEEETRNGIVEATSAIFESNLNADDFEKLRNRLTGAALNLEPAKLKDYWDNATNGLDHLEKTKLQEAIAAKLKNYDNGMSSDELYAAISGKGMSTDKVDPGKEIEFAEVEIKSKPDSKTLAPIVVKANQLFGDHPDKAQDLYAQAAEDNSLNKYSRNYAKGALRYISSLATNNIVLDEVKV